MKTDPSLRQFVLVVSLALAGLATATFAHAGGPAQPAARTAQVTTSRGCATACADATTVTLTSTRTQLPNGRGPRQTVTLGTEIRCQSCVSPAAPTSADRAARGAPKTPAYHVCSSSRTASAP